VFFASQYLLRQRGFSLPRQAWDTRTIRIHIYIYICSLTHAKEDSQTQKGCGREIECFTYTEDRKTDYSKFCKALAHASGIFCPVDKATSRTAYVQQRSELQAQQLQAQNKQQGGGGGGRENYGSGRREAWKLHFSEKLADDCWVLSNGELRGKLWSDKTQVRERESRNQHSFLSFSYVCPELVLVKRCILYKNGAKSGHSFPFRQPARHLSSCSS
jgi:hypothetical protein